MTQILVLLTLEAELANDFATLVAAKSVEIETTEAQEGLAAKSIRCSNSEGKS